MGRDEYRGGWLAVGLLISLVGLAGWSYSRLQASQQRARAARDNLVACQQLAGGIEELRRLPSQASLNARSDAELTGLLDRAANQWGLPPRSLQNIAPQPIRRLEKSPYRVQATRISLRNVTLRQLVSVLMQATQEHPELRVSGLRMSAPHLADPSGSLETWDAEATLTQLIFAPISPAARR